MRLTAGLVAVIAVAACSPDAGVPDASPTEAPSPERAVQTGEVAPLSAPGGSLSGEVSALSGEITAFRVEQTATQTIVEIASDVLFAFDRDALSSEAPVQLGRAADLIRKGGSGPVEVRGYTDSLGEDAYNLDLSRRRAIKVADWLGAEGRIEASRLHPRGYGEADPVAPNAGSEGDDNPEGRALNRRVTIVIPRSQ